MIRRTPLRPGKPPVRRTPLRSGGHIARKTAVKKRSPVRRKSEFARAYHSVERVEFVKSLPCIGDCKRPSQNAHIETGGTGRKADYTKIVPMCYWAHRLFHTWGRPRFEKHFGVDLDQLAARTEELWQEHQRAAA